MKKILVIAIALTCFSASAVEYFKMGGDGKLSVISESDFDGCAKKIYRSSTKDLSPANKKGQLTAALKGQTSDNVKGIPSDTCSYGEASEK